MAAVEPDVGREAAAEDRAEADRGAARARAEDQAEADRGAARAKAADGAVVDRVGVQAKAEDQAEAGRAPAEVKAVAAGPDETRDAAGAAVTADGTTRAPSSVVDA